MSGRKVVYGPMTKKQAKQLNAKPKQKKRAKGKRSGGKAMVSFGGKPSTAVAAAYARGQTSRNPKVTRSGVDRTRIVHRELIGSVVGTVLYSVTAGNTFSINPGLAATFPWLSTQALGWEKYKFNYLRLCYYTRTGSSTPGSVILTPDYNAADAAPVNEQIASAYHGTQEDVAWKDNCMIFDQKILNQDRFIRTGGLTASLDIKTYDIANLFVGTLDGTAVNWGKLWIEYDVTLINQQLNSAGAAGSGTLTAGGGTIAAATPFGAVPVVSGSYNLAAAGTNVITFSGLSIGTEYVFIETLTGTVFSGSPGFTSPVGLTLVTAMFANYPAAATTLAFVSTYKATAVSGSITSNVAATTVTAGQLIVSALTPTPSF